jgi:ABC-type nitrate/sulfonate/bicarbonate transport system substrate-binding protein
MTHQVSTRRRAGFATLAAAGAGMLLLAGCAPAATSADGTELVTLDYQTSWIPLVQFGGSYVAEEEGYYEAAGVDVNILPGGPEVDGMALLESGAADIAVSNTDVVARANAAGADLVIVAAGFQKSPLAVLSLDSAPILTPEDLEGTRIGVPLGDTATHDAFVEVNGIDASTISIVPIGFDVSPLLSGEVDGQYVFYTEQPIAVEDAGLVPETLLLADFNFNVYAQVYVVTRETLENEREAILAFLEGEIKGWQDYVADPTLAVQLTVEEYGADGGLTIEAQTKQAARQLDILVTPTTEEFGLLWMSDEDIASNIATVKALGVDVDESLFDRSLLEELYGDGNSIE